MLVTLQTVSINGQVVKNKESKNIKIEYQILEENGIIENNEITIDEKEYKLFNEIISKLIEKIKDNEKFDLDSIINDLQLDFGDNVILQIISRLSGLRGLKNSAFVVSEGYGRKLDLSFSTDFKLRKNFNIWSYLRNNGQKRYSMTLTINIIPNRELQFTKITEGRQIGFMRGFVGLYLRMPGSVMQNKESHTFFIGYASSVRVFDFSDPLNGR